MDTRRADRSVGQEGAGPGRVLPTLLALLALVGLAATTSSPDPGRHHDHGRFTAQDAGFPPQPAGITATRPLAVSPRALDGADRSAVDIALADARVRRVLGDRFELLGVTVADAKAAWPGSRLVTAYGHDSAATALATVQDGRVVAFRRVPAGRWQPPLLGEERRAAVAIARQVLLSAGQDRVQLLDGFAIHAVEPDGTPPSTRMAYVTFHHGEDARPELVAWVDLTARQVVRWHPEAPPQPRAGPGEAERQGTRSQSPPPAGHIEWGRWSFDYELSGRLDGVSLSSVSYDGVAVLARASLPVMTVFYDHPPGTEPQDTCGPFVDLLGLPDLTPVPWADDAELVLREFTQQGQRWLEIAILDTLGNYVLYQAWYVGEDGQLDAHMFAKGLQCEYDHVHYPFWRFDVDLAGPAADRIRRVTAAGVEVLATEFDAPATTAVGHGWEVHDPTTGDRVRFAFDDGSWTVPGQVVPETLYEQNIVSGRLVDPSESAGWRAPASTMVGFADGEPIDGADVSVWYRGFLPHAVDEGPELWHSTGVRLQVELAPRYYVRPAR